jgi:hypothetical protein
MGRDGHVTEVRSDCLVLPLGHNCAACCWEAGQEPDTGV